MRYIIIKVSAILVIMMLICTSFLTFNRTTEICHVTSQAYHPIPVYLREVETTADKSVLVLQKTLKDERNKLSRDLNLLRQRLGQQDCEGGEDRGVLGFLFKSEDIATNKVGGWCKKSSREDSGEHRTDMRLVEGLSKFFSGKTVGSFGDGPGAYKRELIKLKEVKGYDAYDGAPFCEETSEGRVSFMDLTIPQYGIPIYDWVLSLEVAEHIPKEFENVYIDNLARHNREGIVMSWAVPDQGGLAHINNRPFDYVTKLLERYGFYHDEKQSTVLKQSSSLQWLAQNVNVFRRNGTSYVNMLEKWYT